MLPTFHIPCLVPETRYHFVISSVLTAAAERASERETHTYRVILGSCHTLHPHFLRTGMTNTNHGTLRIHERWNITFLCCIIVLHNCQLATACPGKLHIVDFQALVCSKISSLSSSIHDWFKCMGMLSVTRTVNHPVCISLSCSLSQCYLHTARAAAAGTNT